MTQKLIITALVATVVGIGAASTAAQAGGIGGFTSGKKCTHGCGGGGGGGGGAGGGGFGWGGGFGIHINPGYHGGYGGGYGGGYVEDRISCRTGRRVVRNSGYRRVRTIECRGGTYTYKAKRGSRHYRIKVDAYDGHIVSRRRL